MTESIMIAKTETTILVKYQSDIQQGAVGEEEITSSRH